MKMDSLEGTIDIGWSNEQTGICRGKFREEKRQTVEITKAWKARGKERQTVRQRELQ